MKKLTAVLIIATVIITGFAVSIFNPENEVLTLAGSGVMLAFALAIPVGITEGLLANVRRWHGSVNKKIYPVIQAIKSNVSKEQTLNLNTI
ncbi:MAG: hypothetical protein LBS54_00885 [Dysgonamonadaceae bacterium]|jgi:hypothetical protein|nr:hypothetical protein [Dysgonamonadaceae bacterium]